jgi:retron-type reverse transcriptase
LTTFLLLLLNLVLQFSLILSVLLHTCHSLKGSFPQCTRLIGFSVDEDTPANFRPISNLNNISKLIERLFLSRLQPQILGSPHFDHLQSAYRHHHSTETALLLSLNNIYQAAGNNQPSLHVSLDLSAAFDTIDHSLLLSRLQTSFGISGTARSWLASYLSNRSQFVCIGQSSSLPVSFDSGVPQGSVLGPILFSVYISPIGKLISNFDILHQ